MGPPRLLLLSVTLLLLLPVLPAVAESDASELFLEGVAAGRAGDHEQAVHHFEAARDAGLDTPQLHYNLGVSYRRIGENEAAKQAFRRAARSPEVAGPARYQLGLIALDEGDTAEAGKQFRESERVARTDRLREASRSQLASLGVPTRREPARGRAFVALEGGYDSNVAKTDETAQERTDGAFYGDLLGWGEYRLTPADAADIRISGILNTRLHAGEAEANLLYAQVGPAWHEEIGDWSTRLGFQVSEFQLDGDRVERTAELVAGAERAFPRIGDVRTRVRLGRASGGTGFGYLDGYRHDFRLALQRPQDAIPWFVRYDLIYEDRDDLDTADGGFQSASPLRQGVTAGIRPVLADGSLLEFTASYRVSRFADPDVLPDGDRVRRKDDLIRLEAGLVRPLRGEWDFAIRVSWTDNSSNRDDFEYDRVQASVGVERAF